MVTRCAWYRAEQWDHLLEISTDRDELEDTYEEWVSNAEESLRNMRKAGIYAEKVDVDVEALLMWCQGKGREVDNAARAAYVADLLRE